jgi:hypothetical protein
MYDNFVGRIPKVDPDRIDRLRRHTLIKSQCFPGCKLHLISFDYPYFTNQQDTLTQAIIMVNITSSLMTLLAVASFAAAAPTPLEPQSEVPAHIFEKRAVDCRDDNFGVWKRGNVCHYPIETRLVSLLTHTDRRCSEMHNRTCCPWRSGMPGFCLWNCLQEVWSNHHPRSKCLSSVRGQSRNRDLVRSLYPRSLRS